MDYKKHIHIDPEIRFGKPTIINTRITVYDVLGWLSAGMSIDEIILDFPELSSENILACLAFASDKERKVRVAV